MIVPPPIPNRPARMPGAPPAIRPRKTSSKIPMIAPDLEPDAAALRRLQARKRSVSEWKILVSKSVLEPSKLGQSQQVQWQQGAVQHEDRRQPIDPGISHEGDVARDRHDAQRHHALHVEGGED